MEATKQAEDAVLLLPIKAAGLSLIMQIQSRIYIQYYNLDS